MFRKTILLMLSVALLTPCMAETIEERQAHKHEVRVGWGDMFFEKNFFHASANGVNAHTCDYRYTGHVFAEYQYRVADYFSFGGQLDYDQTFWRVSTEPTASPDHYYVNFAIMPTIRFMYFHSEYVNLYGSFYMGLNVNTGTEVNYRGAHTACALDIGGSIFGLSVGKGHWFGTVETGCLCAFANFNEIYKMFARSLFCSVGYRF